MIHANKKISRLAGATMIFVLTLSNTVFAQSLPSSDDKHAGKPMTQNCQPRGFSPGLTYKSVEQLSDGRVTFRLCAPEATSVRATSDMPGVPWGGFGAGPSGLEMVRDDNGLWSATTSKPVPAETYRYGFDVNGVALPDPKAANFSTRQIGAESVTETIGPEGLFQTWNKEVPHGSVSLVEYWSNTLGIQRRAYVYTPPGYERGKGRFPVLYLMHGGTDGEQSWTGVGHANYILDNLIATGKTKPMIIVMPQGYTPDRPGIDMIRNPDFTADFFGDLIPMVDKRFRTLISPDKRAMAGLSLGGIHVLNNGLIRSDMFHYIGIFSIGLGMSYGPAGIKIGDPVAIDEYEKKNDEALKQAAKNLKLLYYGFGTEDPMRGSLKPTLAVLDKYRIRYVYQESGGGHTWTNWRHYLNDFAPRLFQ